MLGIFLDQETTGLDPFTHKVVEIACKIVDLSSGTCKACYESVVSQPESVWNQRDPSAIMVNGFTQDELAQGKEQGAIGQEIIALFSHLLIQRTHAFFICANPSFDRPFFSHFVPTYRQEALNWPYHWFDLASMYWALEMKKTQEHALELPEKISVSKDSIAQALHLAKENTPHRAMQGVDHLLLCYSHLVGFLP